MHELPTTKRKSVIPAALSAVSIFLVIVGMVGKKESSTSPTIHSLSLSVSIRINWKDLKESEELTGTAEVVEHTPTGYAISSLYLPVPSNLSHMKGTIETWVKDAAIMTMRDAGSMRKNHKSTYMYEHTAYGKSYSTCNFTVTIVNNK